MDTPFANDQPLMPRAEIVEALESVEQPQVAAQVQILSDEKEKLLARALPMVEARDTAAISGLSWNVAVQLQRPIYALWANGFALGGDHMQRAVRLAIPRRERGRFSGVPERVEQYAIAPDVEVLLSTFLNLSPGQLVASAAQAAVLSRVIQLAGNFSIDQITDIKGHLLAAILPQPETGDPISRDDLLKRISGTLGVGERRAQNIARTELTNAYNRGRVSMGQKSPLVETFRFLSLDDLRTTDICRSRNGMLIPATDAVLLAANTPALHFQCRSTLSPVLPRVNAMHRAWMNDPERSPENRMLVPLSDGWR